MQEGIARTYYNYSLLDENVFSKEFYSKLKDRLNSWLSEKTSRGTLTTEEVKKLTSFALNIKTDHDYEEVSLTRKKSPKFKRMVDDMIEVLLDNEFDYWLTHNQGEVIRLIFDIFNKKDEETKDDCRRHGDAAYGNFKEEPLRYPLQPDEAVAGYFP